MVTLNIILGPSGVTGLTQRRDGRDGSVKSGLAGALADNKKGGILTGSAAPSCTTEDQNGPEFRQLRKEMEQRRNVSRKLRYALAFPVRCSLQRSIPTRRLLHWK